MAYLFCDWVKDISRKNLGCLNIIASWSSFRTSTYLEETFPFLFLWPLDCLERKKNSLNASVSKCCNTIRRQFQVREKIHFLLQKRNLPESFIVISLNMFYMRPYLH